MSVKFPWVVMMAGALAFGGAAFAATPQLHKGMKKAPTAQQQKMGNCSHQSKGMKGDAHKKFMSDCMHGKSAMAPMAPMSAKSMQQQKMKDCNMQAKGMKGPARTSFMSGCLKKH